MLDLNEINDFIIKVFNYYNGKINVINKAVLDINWANLMTCKAGGYSLLPNIVVINPMVIIRFYSKNKESILTCIIETIIHELYHTDQLINYRLYDSDINYNKTIEYSCELQTCIYLAGHQDEVYREFGVDIYMEREIYNECISKWDIPGVRYHRRHYLDHIFMCIDDLSRLPSDIGKDLYDTIKYTIQSKNDLYLNINDDIIYIYKNNTPILIEEFNKFMYKFKFTGSLYSECEYGFDGKVGFISIKFKSTNLMCKIV